MAKRRGNPNWGKPEPIGPIVPTITEFEQVVREYKLTPDQYLRSTRLREWGVGEVQLPDSPPSSKAPQLVPLMVLVSMVTAPVSAVTLPHTVALLPRVTLACAIRFPMNVLLEPRVAEPEPPVPTAQKMSPASAPPVSTIAELLAVVSELPTRKMNGASLPPLSVSVPVKSAVDEKT